MPAPTISPTARYAATILVLAAFITSALIRYRNTPGDDLGSSYLACRVLSAGQQDSVYSYDPHYFPDLGPDSAWRTVAAQGNYHSWFHPYVQTPLWIWSLQPLCSHLKFPAFNRLFLLLELLSVAGIILLVASFWTPALLQPASVTAICAALWWSEPFRYALFLTQTHAILLVLAIAGMILAQRGRPVLGGLLVACAATVKITPAALAFYWLFSRRWKAAASLAVWSVTLLIATRLLAGAHLMSLYLADLHRLSGVLLVSENNQSFASWAMGLFYSRDEVYDSNVFPLPTSLRIGSSLLLILTMCAAGLIDRPETEAGTSKDSVPLGAGIALIATTIFAPIAWVHYFIVLIVPAMLLLQQSWLRSSAVLFWATMAALVFDGPPLSPNMRTLSLEQLPLIRSEFYSAMLLLALLAIAAILRKRRSRPLSREVELQSSLASEAKSTVTA